jgi:osmotically-inducible protein OsmY
LDTTPCDSLSPVVLAFLERTAATPGGVRRRLIKIKAPGTLVATVTEPHSAAPPLGGFLMDDKILKKLVEDELAWEPSIDAADVAVTVDKGIVTLEGHAGTYAQKAAAETTVKRVKGVRGFVDRLEILPFGAKYGSDEDIADRAAKVVEWDVTIPKGAVQIQVADGYVTLTGEVEWQYQRFAAEQAVRKLYGIRGMSNQIKLKTRVRAADVKRRIEDALERQADLTAKEIQVTVDGDRVRLDGKVKAWAERKTIERAAWAAPGVKIVEDHVHIAL